MTRRVSFAVSPRDTAGRRPYNPEGAPHVTADMVKGLAHEMGYRITRGDSPSRPSRRGMWWYSRPGEEWRTAGMTNYLAFRTLEGMKR